MKKDVLIKIITSLIVVLIFAMLFVISLINKNKDNKNVVNLTKSGENESFSAKELNYILNSNEIIYLGDSNKVEESYTLTEDELTQKMKVVSDVNTYWKISKCISDYYSYYNSAVTRSGEDYRDREQLFNVLGTEFKSEKEINNENDVGKILNGVEEFFVRSIIRCSTGENGYFYICEGIKTTGEVNKNYKIGILEDYYTKNFCVYPYEFIQAHFSDVTVDSKMTFKFKSVPQNMATSYIDNEVEEYKLIDNYLGIYRACIQYDVEYAYNNYLSDDYKNAKFQSLDDFKSYLRYNKDDELSFEISNRSKMTEFAGGRKITTYKLKLNNGKEFNIKTTNALEFKISYSN